MFYKINIQDNNYLHNLEVYVKQPNVHNYTNPIGELFDIKTIKYLEDKFSKVCFLKPVSSTSYLLEFGNGIRGLHIPGSTITLKKYLTKGESGHLSTNKILLPNSTTRSELTLFINNNATNRNLSNRYLQINFNNSEGGSNALVGHDLRKKVIEYIQSREFLIDKKDYLNLTELKDTDYAYSFKKSDIYRNDFYLHQLIRDEYEVPIKSNCINIQKINTENSVQNFSALLINSSDGLLEYNQDYNYSIFASDSFHISLITNHPTIIFSSLFNSIELSWDAYPNAVEYLIIVENNGSFRYFTTTDTTFIDLGQESNFVNNFIDSYDSDGLPNISWEDSYIFFPEIDNFKSPFVYKYNKERAMLRKEP